VEIVAHHTRRYSSTPDPITRVDRASLIASAAVHPITIAIDISE
jgi:hypothetical protein